MGRVDRKEGERGGGPQGGESGRVQRGVEMGRGATGTRRRGRWQWGEEEEGGFHR